MEPVPESYGFGKINWCYKICLGDYVPGNEKCDDGEKRTRDCEKLISADERMELAAKEYLWPNENEM